MDEERYLTRRTGALWRFSAAVGAAALLAGGLVILSSFLADTTVLLVLKYFCSLVSLFIGFAGLGGGAYYLAFGHAKDARLCVWIAGGATFLTLLIAAILDVLPYAGADSEAFNLVLVGQLTSAVLNTLLSLVLHFSILLLLWLCFFRRRREALPVRFFSLRDPLTRANLLAAAAVLVYQLVGQVTQTIEFINTYAPNIYPREKALLIFDYVFLLASVLLGYTVMYMVQAAHFLTYTGEGEGEA